MKEKKKKKRMALQLFKRLIGKTYSDDEYPQPKKGEHYRLYNRNTKIVIYNKAHVFEMASAGGPSGWGNHIAWSTYPGDRGGNRKTGEIVGFCHMCSLPKVGELIVTLGSLGEYHYFAITKVMPCKDPADMFYANVKVIMSTQEKLDNVTVMN